MRKLIVWLILFLPILVQAEIRWREMKPDTMSDGLPQKRADLRVAFDPLNRIMVLYGGFSPDGGGMKDVWTLDLSIKDGVWTRLDDSPAGCRDSHTLIYDSLNQRVISFGGYHDEIHEVVNNCWSLDSIPYGGRWIELHPESILPDSIFGHTAIYNQKEYQMITFGGRLWSLGVTNDCWMLDLTTWDGVWEKLNPLGQKPEPRHNSPTVYEPVEHRMIIFGGEGSTSLKDCWALDLDTLKWTELHPEGTLPETINLYGVSGHTGIYDPVNQWIVYFGRYGGSNPDAYLNTCWALDISIPGKEKWLALNIEGEPPGKRARHRAVYDPYYRRMVIFGGAKGPVKKPDKETVVYNDLWELSLDVFRDVGVVSISCPESVWVDSTYTLKATVKNYGEVSEAFYVRCVIDILGVVVYDKTKFTNEILPDSISKVGFYYWKVGSTPGVTYNIKVFTTLFCDTVPSNDTAYAQVVSVSGVEETEDRRQETEVRLYEAYPNPFSKKTVIRYSLPVESEHVSLGIYDLSGRLIRSLVDGPINHLSASGGNQPFSTEGARLPSVGQGSASGGNQVIWDGRDELGKKVPSGIYFYKLTCGDFIATKKLLLIR
ncbi:hypothetical protein KAW65_08855 [candidate division WOR-3 bacterium]|nr:hypothetical protein [candidate division WOR-3 bacterium]